jgi:SAM-dependent methyltransferase
MSKPGWRKRRELFDGAATEYEEARPGYPPDVFSLLRERCGLRLGSQVLEIGAGPGQATVPLIEAGAHVTAVEPGGALAQRLEARVGDHGEVIVSTFEAAALPETSFDLVVSATAFHWVDQSVGVPKAAAVLRDGGWLALWWNIFGDASRPDPFHDALQPVLAAKAPHLIADGEQALAYTTDSETRTAEITRGGLFGPVERDVIRWTGKHTPIELRRMFGTFSIWLALEPPLRKELLDDIEAIARDQFGGLVERPYQTIMFMAQRNPSPA